jgi:hypothetical protein
MIENIQIPTTQHPEKNQVPTSRKHAQVRGAEVGKLELGINLEFGGWNLAVGNHLSFRVFFLSFRYADLRISLR